MGQIFNTINTQKLVSGGVRKLIFSVVKGEFETVAFKILCIVCFEAVSRGVDDVSNNRLKYEDVSGITLFRLITLYSPL